VSEFTKEYYQEKVEKLMNDMYSFDSPDRCKIFKFKLDYYTARIEYFERMESLHMEEPNTTIEF